MELIFEDEQILVCYKPYGLATQTAKIGEKDLESEIKNYLFSSGSTNPYLGIVHRLDQVVEGVLVFAKTPLAAAELGKQLTDHTMRKYYTTIVYGKKPEQEQTLIDYLVKDNKTNSARVTKNQKEGKRAELHYKYVQTFEKGNENYHLLKIELNTGRFHQIRAQLAHRGLIIVNDVKYGYPKELMIQKQIALAANQLEFVHPVKKIKESFQIEPKNQVYSYFEE